MSPRSVLPLTTLRASLVASLAAPLLVLLLLESALAQDQQNALEEARSKNQSAVDAEDTASSEDGLQCALDPMVQTFEWTRTFQGVPEPVVWTVERRIDFREAQVEGVYAARELLTLQLPDFRWRFQKYMDSAKVDTCEVQFGVVARTPTAHASIVTMPFLIRYEGYECTSGSRWCPELRSWTKRCADDERKLHSEDVAELDVMFQLEFDQDEMAVRSKATQTPIAGDLKSPDAIRLFSETLDAGNRALELIVGTLGDVSLARLAPDIETTRMESGFTAKDGSRMEMSATYRLSPRQLCRARVAIDSFGARHRKAPEK